MEDENKHQIEELMEELEIILSIKDDISKEEIENFCSKFCLLSEFDIRKKISEVTKNNIYIEKFEHKKEDEDQFVENEEKIKKINLDYNDKEIKIDEKNSSNIEILEERVPNNNDISIIKKDKIIDESNMPKIPFIKAEIKYDQLLLEWGWKDEVKKVLICYRMDKFPIGPKDSSASQIIVSREENSDVGNYAINKITEGNYYFCIYFMAVSNGKNIFSKGQKRLVSNKEPLEIFYEIKSKRNIFGKLKNVEIELSTNEKEINLPQLVLVGKLGNMPIQKSDGEIILNIDYEVLTKESILSFAIPVENLSKNMYVKLFFLDDSNSKLFRIISPSKENLHFK